MILTWRLTILVILGGYSSQSCRVYCIYSLSLGCINGQDIQDYLAKTRNLTNDQDLDAQSNSQFYNPTNDLNVLGTPSNSPYLFMYFNNDKNTNNDFANGSVETIESNAELQPPLDVRASGQGIFNKYLAKSNSPSDSPSTSSSIT